MVILLVDSERGFSEPIQSELAKVVRRPFVDRGQEKTHDDIRYINEWSRYVWRIQYFARITYMHIKRREDNKREMSNVFLCVYTFQIAGIAYTHFMHIELKRTNDNTFRIDLGYFPLGYWNFTFQIIYIMFVTLEFREKKKYKNLLRVFVAMPNRNLSTHSSFLSKQ